MSLIYMLSEEMQLEMFKEFESRRSEFLELAGVAVKKPRERATPQEWDAAINKKRQKAQLKAYQVQYRKVMALKSSLNPEL